MQNKRTILPRLPEETHFRGYTVLPGPYSSLATYDYRHKLQRLPATVVLTPRPWACYPSAFSNYHVHSQAERRGNGQEKPFMASVLWEKLPLFWSHNYLREQGSSKSFEKWNLKMFV